MLTRFDASQHTPPRPFRAFAVRSEEARHATLARRPYPQVLRLGTTCLAAADRLALCRLGLSRMQVAAFDDVDYAAVTLAELAAHTPGSSDLVDAIARALCATGVLGDAVDVYRPRVAARIDFLGCCGAGFHNDVRDHWTSCLFWNLTLSAHDVEFVMPHAGLRIPLVPGDLLVFDPAMAHGLCRRQDAGRAVAASFTGAGSSRAEPQVFLCGELPLTDEQWAAAGSPWLPVETHHAAGALELMAAEFDTCTGAVKRPASLADCLLPSTRYGQDPAH